MKNHRLFNKKYWLLLLRAIILNLIKIYQRTISPDHGIFAQILPYGCRFQPTCSTYAYQAINKYGIIKGGWLALKRLLRCHPWSRGGHDPVP